MIYIARFKTGVASAAPQKTDKTLSEMQVIKAPETCIEITENEYNQLKDGCSASESGGVVTITEPAGWLQKYKNNAKKQEKKKRKKLYVDYRDDIDNSDANISTYKTNLKNYYQDNINNPTAAINTAINKAEVDDAVNAIDWTSVVKP